MYILIINSLYLSLYIYIISSIYLSLYLLLYISIYPSFCRYLYFSIFLLYIAHFIKPYSAFNNMISARFYETGCIYLYSATGRGCCGHRRRYQRRRGHPPRRRWDRHGRRRRLLRGVCRHCPPRWQLCLRGVRCRGGNIYLYIYLYYYAMAQIYQLIGTQICMA